MVLHRKKCKLKTRLKHFVFDKRLWLKVHVIITTILVSQYEDENFLLQSFYLGNYLKEWEEKNPRMITHSSFSIECFHTHFYLQKNFVR